MAPQTHTCGAAADLDLAGVSVRIIVV